MNETMNKKMHRHRFNVADVLLILLAAVIVLITLRVFDPLTLVRGWLTKSDDVTVQYTFLLSDLSESDIELIKTDDSVRLKGNEKALGTVLYTTPTTYSELSLNDSGEAVLTDVEGRYSLSVTVSGKGTKRDNGFYFGDTHLASGETVSLQFASFHTEAEIVGIGLSTGGDVK